MNKVVGIILTLLFLAGLCLLDLTGHSDDSYQVEKYLKTKGKTPIPRSLRSEIGKGI